MTADEAHGILELSARGLGTAEGRMVLGGPGHLWIGVAQAAEAVEIQSPTVEAGGRELVAPGPAIEAMGDREGRSEGAAMDIEYRGRRGGARLLSRQPAQEQLVSRKRARNPEMLLPGIELGLVDHAHGSSARNGPDEGALLVQDATGRLGPAQVVGRLRIGRQFLAIGLIGGEIRKLDQAEGGVRRPRQLRRQIVAGDLAAGAFDLGGEGPNIGLESGELVDIHGIADRERDHGPLLGWSGARARFETPRWRFVVARAPDMRDRIGGVDGERFVAGRSIATGPPAGRGPGDSLQA